MVSRDLSITAVLLLQGVMWGWGMRRGRVRGNFDAGIVSSVGIMPLQDFVVTLTAFTVGWMVFTTQGTFCWRVFTFLACRTAVHWGMRILFIRGGSK